MIKKIREFSVDYWREIVVGVLSVAAFGLLTLPKLGSLIAGNTPYEQPNYLGIQNHSAILHDISFAPLKTLQLVMLKIDQPNVTLLRLMSIFMLAIAACAFYRVVTKWHTTRIALLTTFLFVTSSYSLSLGRFANHEVIYLTVVPLLLLMGTWLKTKQGVKKLPLAAWIIVLMLYIPGVWLLLPPLTILFRKRILLAWKHVTKLGRSFAIGGSLILLIPLLYSFITNPHQLRTWVGFPSEHITNPIDFIKNIGRAPVDLFINGPHEPTKWLINTPVLDIFTIAILILGIYAYRRGHHPLRARLLPGISICSLLLIGLGGSVTIAILLPIIYLGVAQGLAGLLQRWFTVFPRNPFARSVGLFLVCIVVFIAGTYHLKRYYIAWPNATDTKQVLHN